MATDPFEHWPNDIRVARLLILHSDIDGKFASRVQDLELDAGVDSGTFAFFDLQAWRDCGLAGERAEGDHDKDDIYTAVTNCIPYFGNGREMRRSDKDYDARRDQAGVIAVPVNGETKAIGAISFSGYGDGGYTIQAGYDAEGKVVALEVIYISDREEDEG